MAIYEFENRRPQISRSAFVHPMATLIGDVHIGYDVYIGPCAVLRGDFGRIEICDGSNVQENCVIHVRPNERAFLDRDCHIGHGAILHGPTIYENCLIGMNSVIFDGVIIGKDCIIGAGTIILQGTVIEEGKIVTGSPGKVRGDVTEDMIEKKRWGTRLYQSLPARYRMTMKELSLTEVLF